MLSANNIKTTHQDEVVGDCSKKRPDYVIDNGKFQIVVEVDEHQHNSYPCDCEIGRMLMIHQDIGMTTIFIRYNPDNYKVNGKTIKGSSTNPKREVVLVDTIKRLMEMEFNDGLYVSYLYYDKFLEKITISSIDIFNMNLTPKEII